MNNGCNIIWSSHSSEGLSARSVTSAEDSSTCDTRTAPMSRSGSSSEVTACRNSNFVIHGFYYQFKYWQIPMCNETWRIDSLQYGKHILQCPLASKASPDGPQLSHTMLSGNKLLHKNHHIMTFLRRRETRQFEHLATVGWNLNQGIPFGQKGRMDRDQEKETKFTSEIMQHCRSQFQGSILKHMDAARKHNF